jgi:hypothetical protein
VILLGWPAVAVLLAWALDHGVTDGVWGGTTADERHAIRRLASRLTIRRNDDGDS